MLVMIVSGAPPPPPHSVHFVLAVILQFLYLCLCLLDGVVLEPEQEQHDSERPKISQLSAICDETVQCCQHLFQTLYMVLHYPSLFLVALEVEEVSQCLQTRDVVLRIDVGQLLRELQCLGDLMSQCAPPVERIVQ